MADRNLFADIARVELALADTAERWATAVLALPSTDGTPLRTNAETLLTNLPKIRAGLTWLGKVEAGQIAPSSVDQWNKNHLVAQKWLDFATTLRDEAVAHIDGVSDYQTLFETALGSYMPETPSAPRMQEAA
jgi:hypothetical protein